MIAVIGRRTCAVGAMCSAALHGFSLGQAANAAAAALMVAMIVGCLYCARDLWLHDGLQGWTLVAVMNLVMIAIHLPATSAHHHHGGGSAFAAAAPQSTAMTLATAFAASEAIVATAVLFYRTRRTPMSVRGSIG